MSGATCSRAGRNGHILIFFPSSSASSHSFFFFILFFFLHPFSMFFERADKTKELTPKTVLKTLLAHEYLQQDEAIVQQYLIIYLRGEDMT